jgi:hypothetical protein
MSVPTLIAAAMVRDLLENQKLMATSEQIQVMLSHELMYEAGVLKHIANNAILLALAHLMKRGEVVALNQQQLFSPLPVSQFISASYYNKCLLECELYAPTDHRISREVALE